MDLERIIQLLTRFLNLQVPCNQLSYYKNIAMFCNI